MDSNVVLKLYFDGLIYSLQVGGGISRYSTELLNKLVQINHSVDINLLIHDRVKRPGLWDQKIRITTQPANRLLYYLTLKKYFSHQSKGVFHSSYYHDYPECKFPKIVTVYDMIYEKYPKYFGGVKNAENFVNSKRRSILQADFVICISHTTKQDLLEHIPIDEQKVFVTHLAAADIFSKGNLSIQKQSKDPYFIFVGSRAEYKNTDFMLKAFASWKEVKNYFLYIVGSPLTENEHKRIEQLGLSQRIKTFTWPSDAKLKRLYAQSVGYITPSLYEGFGITLVEATQSGTLVLAADIPSTREVIGKSALYFNPTNTESLHHALDLSISQKQRNGKIKLNQSLASQYSWGKTARQTIDIYQKATA